MNRQKGAISLIVTSLVLVVALVLSVTSYRSIFFQIKRAQNEVESRKANWIAEGGLECVYAQIQTNGVSGTPDNCGLSGLTLEIKNEGVGKQLVKAEYSGARIQKAVHGTGGESLESGAMQSASDLYFNDSMTFAVPDPGDYTEDGWECVAIRYKNRMYLHNPQNAGLLTALKPYDDFYHQGKDCRENHKTHGTGDDFVQDENISPFEAYFGVDASEHDAVRDLKDEQDKRIFHLLEGDTIVSAGRNIRKVQNCGTKLTKAIKEEKKHYIWVEGGCEITGAEYTGLTQATQGTKGVTIVVHDGILSLSGVGLFKGVLFHFNRDYSPKEADWNSYEANIHVYGENDSKVVFEKSYRDKASYYQGGSVQFSGAQYFDAPDQSALFFTSTEFKYNKDVVEESLTAFGNKKEWIKGSWHDF